MTQPAPAPPAKTPAAPQAPAGTPQRTGPPRKSLVAPQTFEIRSGAKPGGRKIGIYGGPGVGKSTLAAWLRSPLFIDIERSTVELEVSSVDTITDWLGLRGYLAHLITNGVPSGVETIVIDSMSMAQQLAKDFVIETVPVRRDIRAKSMESYDFGKGWQYLFDEFMALFADLDRLMAANPNLSVCLIAHYCTAEVPNPAGGDYQRWEPHLYAGNKKEEGSIRKEFFAWLDTLVFIQYDLHVDEDGKATGHGSRTAYTAQLGTHVAKSRKSGRPTSCKFTVDDPGAVWEAFGVPHS